jgi:hypothetical protein
MVPEYFLNQSEIDQTIWARIRTNADGILAYFGFPRAHEDDAARAVHAGLEIAEVAAGLQTRARERLSVRVGTRPASSSWATCRQDIAGSMRRTLD